jgi:hypothetical protein
VLNCLSQETTLRMAHDHRYKWANGRQQRLKTLPRVLSQGGEKHVRGDPIMIMGTRAPFPFLHMCFCPATTSGWWVVEFVGFEAAGGRRQKTSH